MNEHQRDYTANRASRGGHKMQEHMEETSKAFPTFCENESCLHMPFRSKPEQQRGRLHRILQCESTFVRTTAPPAVQEPRHHRDTTCEANGATTAMTPPGHKSGQERCHIRNTRGSSRHTPRYTTWTTGGEEQDTHPAKTQPSPDVARS